MIRLNKVSGIIFVTSGVQGRHYTVLDLDVVSLLVPDSRHVQSVQWMWAAVTAAGLTGAYLGYRR